MKICLSALNDQGFQPTGGGTFELFDSGPADRHGIGGLAGGQIGCNYQVGMLVLGIEGEGFWSGMKVTQDQFGGINGSTLNGSASIKNRWDYDVAGRFGVAFDRALVYGKAGWVAGRFDWNSATVNCTFVCTATQASATLDGLLIGLGLEYAFFNNWTAKFEYDYLGFDSKNVRFTTICSGFCGPSPIFTNTQNVSADKHIYCQHQKPRGGSRGFLLSALPWPSERRIRNDGATLGDSLRGAAHAMMRGNRESGSPCAFSAFQYLRRSCAPSLPRWSMAG